jgi:O-palmitoleoyl-L-serine hydrolase
MARSLLLLALGTVGSAAAGADAVPPTPPPFLANMTMQRYDLSAAKNQVCLDGTPGVFYMRNGTGSGARKYYVHYQGGGWCESPADCAGRSHSHLGSSSGYAKGTLAGQVQNHGRGCPSGGYFSTLPDTNPLMYNWNVVYLMYCDGGSFTGSRTAAAAQGPHNQSGDSGAAAAAATVAAPLQYHGKEIREGVQTMLLEQLGMNRATDVVISGASAGALAVYLTLDLWCDAVKAASPGATCIGMPDSGFCESEHPLRLALLCSRSAPKFQQRVRSRLHTIHCCCCCCFTRYSP